MPAVSLGRRVARASDTVLDSAVFALAVWTVVYHVFLVTGTHARWAVLAGGLALPSCVWLAWRAEACRESPRAEKSPRAGELPYSGEAASRDGHRILAGVALAAAAVTVAAATAAAVLFALRTGPWWWTWALWLTAAVAGTLRAVLLRRAAEPGRDERAGPRGAAAALAWAAALAVLSLFMVNPDLDDAFYVNRGTWIAEHGFFPLRDTLFSDLSYRILYWPPVSSYEALTGTVSRVLQVPHFDVVYLIVPPLGTFLAVLALWRLLRAWQVQAVGVALTLAVLFLLWGGELHRSYGGLFVGRMWQGKTILLCVLVPLLLVYLQRFADRPSVSRGAALVAAGIAGVGLSVNAIFLVPLIAVAGVVPLIPRAPVRSVVGFLAAAGYPLGAGGVTLAVGGYSPNDYAELREVTVPAWLTHEVLGDGYLAGVALFAVLVGALLVRQPTSRVVVGALAVVAGIVYAPTVPLHILDLFGLGRTLWRVMWILPAAALVGVFAAWVLTAGRWRALRFGPPLLLAGALVISGTPIWSDRADAELASTPQRKRPPETIPVAQEILRTAQPGDVVLAPGGFNITVATMTSRVKTATARRSYMDPYADVPGFHAPERRRLKRFVGGSLPDTRMAGIPRDLRVVGVDIVCLDPRVVPTGPRILAVDGFTQLPRTEPLACFTRR